MIIPLLILLVFITIFVLQWKAKGVVEDFLARKIPSHLVLAYQDIGVNIFTGNIHLYHVSLEIQNRDTLMTHTKISSDGVVLEGLGYWQLLFNNTITLNHLVLEKPLLNYYPYKYIPRKKAASRGVVNLLKSIAVDKIDIQEGGFNLMKEASDSLQVSIAAYNFTLFGGRTDSVLIAKKIPLEYKSYDLVAKDIYADLGEFERLKINQIKASEQQLSAHDVYLATKYNKDELSHHTNLERDHVQLQIPKIMVREIDFGFDFDRFGIAVGAVIIDRPKAEIYRDKLLPDDMDIKPLYSKLLRDLPLAVAVDSVVVQNGYIAYSEKIEQGQEAGSIYFENLDANLLNITNHKDAKKTQVSATAMLMGEADFDLQCEFDVNQTSDAFVASGVLKNLQASRLNSFLGPNLRARAKGSVQEMYFTLSGNADRSIGDMKMKYKDFKFTILDKDRHNVNKLLTFVGNILVNDGSKTDAEGYRYGQMQVEREPNKSFYNYLWLNVRDGMVSTLTGNGKKE